MATLLKEGFNEFPNLPRRAFETIGRRFTRSREEGLGRISIEVSTFPQESLVPILEWAFGADKEEWKKWKKDEDWILRYKNPDQALTKDWTEEVKSAFLDLRTILGWASDLETRGHLDPAPGVPVWNEEHSKIMDHKIPNRRSIEDVSLAIADLARYYYNNGEPNKIIPLMARDARSNALLGVETARRKGDEFVPHKKIGSIETLIVDPEKRRKGIATALTRAALHKFFVEEDFSEVRAWVMADKEAGNYSPNINLFINRFGFQPVRDENVTWRTLAQKRGIVTDRNALWFSLKKEVFLKNNQ